jgi:LEA14-like dessication related protein
MALRAARLVWLLALAGCATLPKSDPINVSVAGIEPLPSEGLELRLAVRLRVQNPNDAPIEYSGAALTLDLNGRKLATGVSDDVGTVPRYGESVLTIAVTAPVLAMVRQGFSFLTDGAPDDVRYEVNGKLEAGLFGTRRFSDEGTFTLRPPGAASTP